MPLSSPDPAPDRTEAVPVIAIDGPGGSGKGTVSTALAAELGFHYLDSGALYRILGHLAWINNVALSDEEALVRLWAGINIEFKNAEVFLDDRPLGDIIRTEEAGKRASLVSPIPAVREALLGWQRSQARSPGLVADGRDMGTVVFARAKCKFFITASAQARAERRFKQLREKGFDVTIPQLFEEIRERDARDENRAVSPLKPAGDAVILDTTNLEIREVVVEVLGRVKRCLDCSSG